MALTHTLHWSFTGHPHIQEAMALGFGATPSTLPSGPFDPRGDWELAYDIMPNAPRGRNTPGIADDRYLGSLRLGLTAGGATRRLSAREIRQSGGDGFTEERMFTEAECECSNQPLLPLAEGGTWKIDTVLRQVHDPQSRPYARHVQEGRVREGRIEKNSHGSGWYPASGAPTGAPLVSDWALMAALTALPCEGEFRFDLIRQLETFYPGQKLKALGPFDAKFGPNAVRLHGYAHTGEGTLPSFYWVDDTGRMVLAVTALNYYLHNPKPRLEQEPLHES
jgi:hypothetical protein